MKQKKEKSGSVKVDPGVLKDVKGFCKSKGLIVGYFTTEALREKLQKEKQVITKISGGCI